MLLISKELVGVVSVVGLRSGFIEQFDCVQQISSYCTYAKSHHTHHSTTSSRKRGSS